MTIRARPILTLILLLNILAPTGCRKGALVQLEERGWTVTGSGSSLELTAGTVPPSRSTPILSRLRGDFSIRIGRMDPQVTEWAGLPHLKGLTISDPELRDLSFLRGFTQLSRLSLAGTAIGNLQPIANLKELIRLDLGGTKVVDVSPLAGLRQLQVLNLSRTPVRDVTPLTGLHNLSRLDLENTLVSDVSGVAALPRLKRLSTTGTPAQTPVPSH